MVNDTSAKLHANFRQWGGAVSVISQYDVPYFIKFHQQAHAAAGALIGGTVDLAMRHFLPMETRAGHVVRIVSAVGVALAVGAIKEHGLDLHARDKEIGPWGIGAGAAALACEFVWRF